MDLLFTNVSAVLYSLVISVFVLASFGFLMKVMTEKDGLDGPASWCLAIAPALSGNFLWFGTLGMEHLLFILLSLCVITIWFSTEHKARLLQNCLLLASCFLLVILDLKVLCLSVFFISPGLELDEHFMIGRSP